MSCKDTWISVPNPARRVNCREREMALFHDISWDSFRIEEHRPDFVVHDVPPDGSCMFHAISQSLRERYGLELSHVEVRRMVVQDLRENPLDASGTPFKFFLSPLSDLGYDTELPDDLDLLTEMLPTEEERMEQRWYDYLFRLERGAYGDDLCLVSAARIFGIRIVVFAIGDDGRSFTTTFGPEGATSIIFLQLENLHYKWLDSSPSPDGDVKKKKKKKKKKKNKKRQEAVAAAGEE